MPAPTTEGRPQPGGARGHEPSPDFARSVLRAEARAIEDVAERMSSERIAAAVELLTRCAEGPGSVLVSGMGKSGLIGAKISATLASLGVASHTIHPAEAVHGDLGRFQKHDVLLALSYSGETEELVTLASLVKQDGLEVVSVTGGDGSSALARLATVALPLGTIEEASALALAPTSSTTATLALGDALALAVARERSFTSDDFARHHPGGTLGGLLRPVTSLLRFEVGKNLAVVPAGTSVADALRSGDAAGRRPGAMLIVDEAGSLRGIFTDGDLRRLVTADASKLAGPIDDVMTSSPRVLRVDQLVRDAVRMVREHRQDEIPVVAADGTPVGLLDVQDLIAMRVVAK